MRLDQGSLIFRKENGECPPWETALGQSREPKDDLPPYYFKAEGYENILKGILYNSVPLAQISCVFGKKKIFVSAIDSFSNPQNQEIQLAGKFDNIVIHYNGKKRAIKNSPIILLVTKTQDPEKSHFGRRSIKYSPHTKYENIMNQDSFDRIQSYYEDRLMCYGLFVEHFDTLHLYCVKAGIHYEKSEWDELKLPETDWTDWVDWELKERERIRNENSANSSQENTPVEQPSQNQLFFPSQIIYYGVPGCGKSHQIQEDLKKKNITEENQQVKRVVFHPDYCNADFVGQILPVTKRDGGIRYQFKAGPFTKILRAAYENPSKEYALIIEEINRGNAAAIFGDLFQLLDRKRASDPVEVVNGNSYGSGWSDYCVENDYVNAYFRGAYDEEETPNPLPPKTLGNITFNDNVDIRLPPNLSLYATMNTSDQNVFTLDNAFQRRWEMKQISNKLRNEIPKDLKEVEKKAAQAEVDQYNETIGNTNVKWGVFREKINEIIMQSAEENGLSSMEDKRLGGWFIVPKKAADAPEGAVATITSEAFAEKVLKYLWDDAFKFDRKSHFGDVKTLEKLIENFKTEGFKVFLDEQISGLSQNGSASTQTGMSES